jgi:hypothetical protein
MRILRSFFFYGYYGTFLKVFIGFEPRPKKNAPETLISEKPLEKLSRFITDVTEISITEYYRIFRNILNYTEYYGP